MQIPKYIEIKTADGKTSAFLSPKADGLKDVYVDCRLNGESTLEFQLPATSEKLAELTPECQIWAGGRVYSLLKEDAIDIVRDENNKLWAKVMAVERWMDLDYQFPEPYICNDPTITNPADLTVIIVGGGTDLSGGRYAVGTAGHALYAVLNGSGWSVGTVDVTGIHDLEMEKASRLELIKQIQNTWGGYLVWDSINKTVSLRSGDTWQPYTGFQIRYKKNLKHITRTQSNKIYTKIYPFGHDDLDIAAVNGGVKYITNYSYTSRTYVGIYKNQDIYDAQELMDKATAELELNCKPRYNYKVKIADLRTLPEYSHEDFAVGDMADVIDPTAAPDSPRPRILRHKYNLFQPWDCEIELGDPEERLIEDLKASFDTSNFVGSVFNSRGLSSGESIEDLTITNAKIVSLSADKITAGTIRATIEITSPIINGGTINGVYINGSIITGSLIRTDEDGNNRIEISSGGLYSYDNNDRWHGLVIDIGESVNALGFFYRDDMVGTIAAIDSTLSIYPAAGGYLTLGSSSATTYTHGAWCFNDEIGFFGNTPVSQQSAQRLDTSASLLQVIIKINGILDKLDKYGLFYVYD